MHAAKTAPMLPIANIRAALGQVMKVAEQSPATDRWKTLLNYIVARITPVTPENSSTPVRFCFPTAAFRIKFLFDGIRKGPCRH